MGMGQKHNDHIILPNATLKRFCGEDNMISVLNFSSPDKCDITKHFPKSFHTKDQYYDPQVDSKIKVLETSIGNWNAQILRALDHNDFSIIDFEKLKSFVIQIITLQFHRCVMADSKMRAEFIDLKLKEYDADLLFFLKIESDRLWNF